ncbi:hypothetical protein [Streptomyces sp. cmx-4-9]|uniref:hypothetical protein n=1 Tax=Streptomyces sp. cmx-4-9 TaxID=2790941 RepID=UPI0039809156
MSAPTHTRPLPPRSRAGSGADPRLHWWALVLPALGFGLMLLLLAGSAEAHAAPGEAAGLLHVTQQFLRAVG